MFARVPRWKLLKHQLADLGLGAGAACRRACWDD